MGESPSERLDVNQQYQSPTDQPYDYAPNEEEAQDLKMVQVLLERGKKARKEYDKDWNRQRDYYRGKQWIGRKRPSYRASPVANVIRSTVETIIPILTDTTPGFDTMPQEPSDYEFAEMLSKAIRSWWQTTGMDHTLVETLYDQSIEDVGIIKVPWNPEAKEGMGDIDCYAVDPRNIYVPDGTIDFDKKCPWVTEIIPGKSVGEIKRKFPDKASLIRPTGSTKAQEESREQTYSGEVVLVSPVDRKMPLSDVTDVQQGDYNDEHTLDIAETWLDDFSTEDYDLEPDSAGNVEQGTRKKYPYGKLITWIPDLKVILQSKPSPYRDGKKPYVRFIDTLRPRLFWGRGVVQPLLETQDMINKTYSVIMDWMNTMVNPVWILDDDSGVDPGMISNQVGLIICKKANTTVRREEAPSLPAQVFSFSQQLGELLDTQSGVHDVTQGRKPTGITAAAAISEMQEAAQTRIRLKERNMQVSLQQLGQLCISRVLQYYREPRMVKLTGKDGWPEYFEFYVNEDAEGKYTYTKRGYTRDPESGIYTADQAWTPAEQPSKGQFDIEVVTGTALPFMKEKRDSLMMSLFDKQAIDQEALLNALEIPDKEEIMKRMNEQAQAAAQQASPMPGA